MENIIYNFVAIKNMKNIIGEISGQEIPFQFFCFSLDSNNKLKIEYQFKDLIDVNNVKMREYIAKLNKFYYYPEISTLSVRGIIFEELVAATLMNNKSGFKNLNFDQDNIISVESIYKMKDIKPRNDLKDGPIFIYQTFERGEVFDFGIIMDYNNITYFIGGQSGLNKGDKEIESYISKLYDGESTIIKNLNKLTERNITQMKFIIIFSKERQEELKKEYEKIYKELYSENKTEITFGKEKIQEKKRRLSHFTNKFGIKCCEKEDLSYLLFSTNDFCFYDNNFQKIESFDFYDFKPFRKDFKSFCIQEYNLVPFVITNNLLSIDEKRLLLKELKKLIPNIKDLTIDYKVNGKISLLPATPENTGILSITTKFKLFTYFMGKYTFYLLQKGKIKKYEYSDKLFDDNYRNDSLLERYFVKFIYDEICDDEEKEEKNKTKKEKEKSEKMEYYKNNLKYLQHKRNYENN